jgi:hypothetical protein
VKNEARGWDLFAARQLVQENGGILRVEGSKTGEQLVLTAQDHHALEGTA